MNLSISVAMCTFNGSRFLRSQLESIAAQTRLPDELVVCDDGSNDNSIQIVRDFARLSSFPVRALVNDSNVGSTKNFEQAISLSTGEIVVLADQDDFWYPHKLETIERAFLQDKEFVAVFSDADLIDEDSRPIGARLWTSFALGRREASKFQKGKGLDVLVRHPVVTGAAMAFRRNVFSYVAPFPTTHVHDEWIAFLLAAQGKIRAIPEPLMQYRRHKFQQLGPGTLGLFADLERAKSTPREAYTLETRKFLVLKQFITANAENFPLHATAQRLLEKKIRHLQHRAQLSSSRSARLPEILRETLTGRYWRFSAGWKSIAKDLLLA